MDHDCDRIRAAWVTACLDRGERGKDHRKAGVAKVGVEVEVNQCVVIFACVWTRMSLYVCLFAR